MSIGKTDRVEIAVLQVGYPVASVTPDMIVTRTNKMARFIGRNHLLGFDLAS
jgi:hypothetical protein